MRPAHIIEIQTPEKYLLNGLWLGPVKPKRAIIWVHGLGSSAFSKLNLCEELADKETAVLAFNNRGFERVVFVRKNVDSKKNRTLAGSVYERFEDCVDDIQGAINFVKKQGAKEIYLAGHSTGCQKSAYWAYKNGKGVKGVVLLAPMSDYAGMVKEYGLPKVRQMQSIARALVKSGKGEELVRAKFWHHQPDSAKRFLSLYTPDSVEQSIFSYFDPTRRAKVLSSIRIPILNILASEDEFADRPAREIVEWFENNTKAPLMTLVVQGANHGFKGHEKPIARAIKSWIVNEK